MLWICIAIYAVLLLWLLKLAEEKQPRANYPIVKTAVSIGFVVIAALSYALCAERNTLYFYAMLPCLLLCLAGDVSLALATVRPTAFTRWFLGGVGSFLLAHIGFCAVFTCLLPVVTLAVWEVVAALLVAAVCGLLMRSRSFLMRRMQVPVLIYSFFVGLMCIKGVKFAVLTASPLVGAGSVLFLLSDLVLFFVYFYREQRRHWRAANLALYYTGMLCLALSFL